MNPHPAAELVDLYRRWRELTADEGAAIASERWSRVTELQTQKSGLQTSVDRLTAQLPKDARLPAELATILRELVGMESENSRMLDQKLEAARSEQADLDRSGHNLRRLRGSYGQARTACWQSYS